MARLISQQVFFEFLLLFGQSLVILTWYAYCLLKVVLTAWFQRIFSCVHEFKSFQSLLRPIKQSLRLQILFNTKWQLSGFEANHREIPRINLALNRTNDLTVWQLKINNAALLSLSNCTVFRTVFRFLYDGQFIDTLECVRYFKQLSLRRSKRSALIHGSNFAKKILLSWVV